MANRSLYPPRRVRPLLTSASLREPTFIPKVNFLLRPQIVWTGGLTLSERNHRQACLPVRKGPKLNARQLLAINFSPPGSNLSQPNFFFSLGVIQILPPPPAVGRGGDCPAFNFPRYETPSWVSPLSTPLILLRPLIAFPCPKLLNPTLSTPPLQLRACITLKMRVFLNGASSSLLSLWLERKFNQPQGLSQNIQKDVLPRVNWVFPSIILKVYYSLHSEFTLSFHFHLLPPHPFSCLCYYYDSRKDISCILNSEQREGKGSLSVKGDSFTIIMGISSSQPKNHVF